MHPRIIDISDSGSDQLLTMDRLMVRLAIRRGCKSPEQIKAFLNPNPPLENPLKALPRAGEAIARIQAAVRNHQPIVVFGDYDADGVCSIAILVSLLQTARAKVSWHIPVRRTDEYGLTLSAAQDVIKTSHPDLLIAVDCGSNSEPAITTLTEAGCDTIVVDHHSISAAAVSSAFADLNPKANPAIDPTAATLCAAGLTFFLCEILAAAMDLDWDRDATLLLAGLATLVDVVPLTGLNRGLLKHSLTFANTPSIRERIPGIDLLLKERSGTVTAWTYGFHLGPILNATGRIDDARRAVQLLLTRSREDAEPLATECLRLNQIRKSEQEKIYDEALEATEKLLAEKPDTKVVVLGRPHWNPGIVGIVASHLKEKFHHPVLLFGLTPNGDLKGSGRSILGYDLGAAANAAVTHHVALRGGGHSMAAGLTIAPDRLTELARFLNETCPLSPEDLVATYEVITAQPQMHVRDWLTLFAILEPFGAENPRPCLVLNDATVAGPIRPLRKRPGEGEQLLKYNDRPLAGIRVEMLFNGSIYTCTWFDAPQATACFANQPAQTRYRVVLSLRVDKAPIAPSQGYEWLIEAAFPV